MMHEMTEKINTPKLDRYFHTFTTHFICMLNFLFQVSIPKTNTPHSFPAVGGVSPSFCPQDDIIIWTQVCTAFIRNKRKKNTRY
jgi:hypothetical protein